MTRFAMYMYVEYYTKRVTFVVSSVFLYVKFHFFCFTRTKSCFDLFHVTLKLLPILSKCVRVERLHFIHSQ